MKKDYPNQQIYERDNFTCQYCGWNGSKDYDSFYIAVLSVDHIVPISRAGTDDDSNLVLCCHACNLSKSDADVHSFKEAKQLVLDRREAGRKWFETYTGKSNN